MGRPKKPGETRLAYALDALKDIDSLAEGMLLAFRDVAEEYPDLPVMDMATIPQLHLERVVARLRELVRAQELIGHRTMPRE